jgi:type I restriction-modification system DNA methylase subunit
MAILRQVKSHLWEAANILRGPMDAADFKSCVFPLLFFKPLSDAHDEEYQVALEESGGDEAYARFPQHYRFQVPEVCHWLDVRAVTTNVGQVPQTALLSDVLLHEHVERIHGWYHAYQNVAGVPHGVTPKEIAANVYNLNIPRHIEPMVEQEVLTVEEAMQCFQASIEAAFAVEEKLIALHKRDGLLL